MSEPEVHYYCLEELAESAKILQAIREQLPVIQAQYRQHRGTGQRQEIEALVDMQAAVRRLWGEFPGLVQRLCEYGDDELLKTARKLYEALRRYDYLGASDLTPLCRALEAFEQMLPTPGRNINAAALGRLMNRVRMGYQPTDPAHVDLLRRAVVFPTEPVNLLDPCCGEGEALARFADGANAVTYGIEIDELRGEMAQRRLNRVGFGSFFFSRVSSGAFQGLFLNPPYLSVRTEYGSRRLEKSFLADGLRLLQNGGLLVYIIPYYRASPDICRVLCENLNDLRVHRFMGQEFRQFRQVVFLGTKIPRREASGMAERLFTYLLSPQNIPELDQLPESAYVIPPAAKPVEQFKGDQFNVAELAEQLKRSKTLDCLFENRTLDNRERRPLLPMNLSQIGLIGASGLMNGLVECDTPHVIKGRIVKEKKTHIGIPDESGKAEIRQVTSNKLIFNVLTPTGYHSLG